MKEFTSTQLRIKSTDVYNDVHTSGIVRITHRDRPLMVLMTMDHFELRVKQAAARN